jgi:endonuclease-3
MLTQSSIKKVLELLESEYSETTTALNYGTPFQLLVSTMLAAQSTDKRVNIVTKELFQDYPDAESFLSLPISEMENLIKTIGLYKSKAKNVLATCRLLVEKYDGKVPLTREELVQLPGVGRKTANVILSIVTDFKAIAVDTHIPEKDWSDAHHWLIWHGRKVCKARNPVCDICFLNPYCQYYNKNSRRSL